MGTVFINMSYPCVRQPESHYQILGSNLKLCPAQFYAGGGGIITNCLLCLGGAHTVNTNR